MACQTRLVRDRHLDDACVKHSRFDHHLGGPAKGAVAHPQFLEQLYANGSKRWNVGDPLPVSPGNQGGDKSRAQGGVEWMRTGQMAGS